MKRIASMIAALPVIFGLYFLSRCFTGAPSRDAPLAAYNNPIDLFAAVVPDWVARKYNLRAPCEGERIDTCVAMTDRQTFTGVWLNYNYGLADFFPGETEIRYAGCEIPGHLTFQSDAEEERHRAYDKAHRQLAGGELITFLGRKTRYRGRYTGGAREDYLIDEIVRFRPIDGVMTIACPM